MPSKEHELIKQIKIAEQKADQMINDAQNEVNLLLEKAQSDRIRSIESAKTESREILKKKMENAKDTTKYEEILKQARDETDLLRNKIKDRIPEVAEQITDFILKLGKEG